MGDGGVACAPSQHVMERLAIPDGFCGGGGNGGFGPKGNQLAAEPLLERKMGLDGGGGEGGGAAAPAPRRALKSEVEKVGAVSSSGRSRQQRGEAGQSPGGEIEKGEIVPENGEAGAGRWGKGELENGEFVPEKWRHEGDAKGRSSHRVSMDELENGEFVPDKWRRSEAERAKPLRGGEEAKDGFLSEKVQSWELEKGEIAPESCGANDHNASSRRNQSSSSSSSKRGGGRELSASRRKRSSSRWDPSVEKELPKSGSSKGDEKLEPAKNDSNRKYHGEYSHPSGSKCRRLSVDGHSSSHSEKLHSRLSVERAYKNSCSSTKVSSSSRYESPRHHDSSSSKGAHEKHGKSPAYSERERSPHDRARKAEHRDRSSRSHHDRGSPGHSLRSPLDRSGRHHRHGRSPVHLERSPLDRNRDYRERTPKRSPADSGRDSGRMRSNGKSKGSSEGLEKQHNRSDEKTGSRDSNGSGRDSHKSSTSRHTRKNNDSSDKGIENQSLRDNDAQNDVSVCADDPPTKEAGDHEELPSMEEDMDICNTPPHAPVTVDLNMGKWFYLDHSGLEQGPSKLGDLKQLVEEGIIQSDHLVKHSESDRWVTVENAASPLISVNYSTIVSDSVTQLVTPPEAPGNLLLDSGNSQNHLIQYDDNSSGQEYAEDLHIDERIEALMEGRVLVPGQELVTLGEALNLTFEHVEWEKWGTSEDFMTSRSCFRESLLRQREQDYGGGAQVVTKENSEARVYVNSEKDYSHPNTGLCEWFTGHWTCKGGDWKRNDEVALDKAFRKKVVLNEGYPLCQASKTGLEDPRRHRKEDLYVSLRGRKLDLPLWAFSWSEENNDSNAVVKSCQMKPLATRVKGTMQPVVRINTCVVRDRGSAVGESRHKSRSNDRQASSKSVKSFSSNTDAKGSSTEGVSRPKRALEEEITPRGNKSRTFINIPKDRVRRMNELELSLGEWFYLDGAGHEHGPKSFSELQVLAAKGTIEMNSSIFRKVDNLWVPISNVVATSRSARSREGKLCSVGTSSTSSFNIMHPQFVGYMRGKLHELVMKSFRSREFAAAINEVLDPWIAAKQPKKEIDRQFAFNNSLPKDEGHGRFGKRARFMSDGFEETDDIEEEPLLSQKDHTFEDLLPEIPHNQYSDSSSDGWGLLNCHILARVFHFLRTDFKSLAVCAGTCRFWNNAVKAYRSVSKHVDFSFIGPACTDAIFNTILLGYDKSKVKSISLRGCSNINITAVVDILKSFLSIESIDIRESGHLGELSASYKEVNWIGGRRFVDTNPEDSYSKIRSLKQVTERSYINSRANWEYGSHIYDPANKSNSLSDRKFLVANSLQQTPYYRRKLFGARKASAVLSRDAHLRRWLNLNSENRYKKMEEYLASYLKDIMKKNTCDFFVPKVAEIEDKMKNGYYTGHGLSSIKEDISKMCRAAFKTKNHGDKGEMNRMIMLFIKLIRSLDNPPRISSSRPRDEVEGGPTASTYKKKLGKTISEKKGLRSNGSIYGDGITENGERASDREIKRRLNKLNRRTLDSESETSDDLDPSEEDSNGADGDGTNSDTESDIDFHSVSVTEDAGEGFSFVVDGPMDSMADEREWGARMTKASLVPPVTRKYEVIDQYVITADAEEVQRKMRVSLPDDYADRLKAQKDSDEPDLDFVEVKEYKPRKKLGDEVLEQEVYGIDPYTHNLLLDSVPEEMPDWTFLEKHMFIEELVLRVLNKQVRHFTDTGSTPMTYPLRLVLEEIQRTAEDDGDKRITKLCQIILKAIRSRPEDHYVAYRKGLGVVCDKEGGFKDDDFVVEFLGEVYPAWRWFEKQDGIRSLQKNKEDPAPEFYNIYLERPKGDKDGYDLVVVDAMHKANYASRICHSCKPNCEAKVTAVNGQYQIGIYAIRPIAFGEEITFDYNSVTESKEEYEASVCLCGSQVCRGSYLNLTGDGAFQKVMKECHGILDRHKLMLEACELNYVTEDDYLDLGRASLGSCLLSGLPDWVIAYSARMVRFINFERTKLPDEILAYNLEEKRKLYLDVSLEVEKNEAEVQAEGVYNQRLQNLAITLDKVRYVLRSVYGDARKAPPPLEKLSPESLVSALWKGSGSLVDELLQCMAPHMEEEILNELKLKIDAHDPSGSSDVQKELQKSLLWLRDEVRNLPCSPKCRHDAAADLIHVYAYTKCFFRVRGHGQVTSEPVYISPLDLGPKYADKMSSGGQEYLKTYSENYCLGQLIYWHNQTNPDPDCRLTRARQGCLLLPDLTSFYFKSQKPSPQRVYGRRTVKFMLSRMEKQPQRSWPKNRIWQFKSDPKIFGSPMLDVVISKSKLDKEMVHWLRSRTSMYQATWDR